MVRFWPSKGEWIQLNLSILVGALLGVLLSGCIEAPCNPHDPSRCDACEEGCDLDGDGVTTASGDCNDEDATIYSGAEPSCDGQDYDCDSIPDVCSSPPPELLWYLDSDEDGYGDAEQTLMASDQPEGYVENGDDCDDSNDDIHPDADETCNGLDDDCNGRLPTNERDSDDDGFSTCQDDCDDDDDELYPGAVELCDDLDNDCNGEVDDVLDVDSDGYSTCEDCNDFDDSVYPDPSAEVCNGRDDDCDIQIDEELELDYYPDADNDTFGDASADPTSLCQPTDGFVSNQDDCDDSNVGINPTSDEVCDGLDNNCDGVIDEDLSAVIIYADSDDDGYGDPNTSKSTCEAVDGYVDNDDDCNDANAAIHPNASEICNGTDDDCDAEMDENVSLVFYLDQDHDGYGNTDRPSYGCEIPDGYTSEAGDCNDESATVNPAASETCDKIDNNCNGSIDEGVLISYFPDDDGDSYGDQGAAAVKDCQAPAGYAANNSDCNDASASTHPGAVESCNGIDDDCDAVVDDGLSIKRIFADRDGDGYGDASSSINACEGYPGYVTNSTDCDDTDPYVNPSATEVCNHIDDDCDADVDEGTDCTDADKDGYSIQFDCNDNAPDVNPGVTEAVEADGIDNNCNGQIDENTDCYDDDSDGYIEKQDVNSCPNVQPENDVPAGGDCDDANGQIHPDATEVFNRLDDDCDGRIDYQIRLMTGSRVDGILSDATFGESVAILPDLDQDSFDEIGVGAPSYNQNVGAAYLIYGRADGWETVTLSDAGGTGERVISLINDRGISTRFGAAITGAGDLDNDGWNDFVVGEPDAPAQITGAIGDIFFFSGKDAAGWVDGDPVSQASAVISGFTVGLRFGASLSGGGDMNNDHIDDLLIGAPAKDSASLVSSVYVLPGSSDGIGGDLGVTDLFTITGPNGGIIGTAVAYGGNISNGEGDSESIGDFIIGGKNNSASNNARGVVYFVKGNARFTGGATATATIGQVKSGEYVGESSESGWVGYSVSSAGDVDQDGYSDFIVGRQSRDVSTYAVAYLMLGNSVPPGGSTSTMSENADVRFLDDISGDTDPCPCAVSVVGDVNQDGHAEIAIGLARSQTNGTDSGLVLLYFGGNTTWDGEIALGDADAVFVGEAGDQAGGYLSNGGDLNGDSYADFVVGAPKATTKDGENAGRIYITFGF